MKVVLAARRVDRLDAAVAELQADGFDVVGVATDVAELEQVRHLADVAYDEFGRVDVAFFNAGSPSADRLVDPDLGVWHAAIATNVLGLLHGLKAFLPRMVEGGTECSVLATTSGAGIHGTAYDTAPYAATKAAQLSIMESLYGQVRDQGLPVHVGVVVPPLTRTNLAGDDLLDLGARRHGPGEARDPGCADRTRGAGCRSSSKVSNGVRSGSKPVSTRTRATSAVGTVTTIARNHEIIRAKADAMIGHLPPDGYLW